MADKLAALIRLHKWRLDEQRRTLADATRELEQLQQQSRALEREIADEQQAASAAPAEAGFAYARFARSAVERRAACRDGIGAAEKGVAAHRDKLQACYRELRTFELAEENRKQRAQAESARREGLAMDEIALLARARGGGDDATAQLRGSGLVRARHCRQASTIANGDSLEGR